MGDGRSGWRRPAGGAIAALVLLCGCRDAETARESPPGVTTTRAVEQAAPIWRALPVAPIAGRIAAGSVWTGREMIVWGGLAGTEKAQANDGAAYDPVAGTWRTIAPAPAGVAGEAHLGAVWTGDEAVFWTGNSPDGPASGAVYNPGTNAWRRLAGGPLGIRDGYTSVWTGSEMLIIGGHGGRGYSTPVAAAVNPRSGAWRLLPAFDDLFGLQLDKAVWDGNEVLALGSLSTCPARSGVRRVQAHLPRLRPGDECPPRDQLGRGALRHDRPHGHGRLDRHRGGVREVLGVVGRHRAVRPEVAEVADGARESLPTGRRLRAGRVARGSLRRGMRGQPPAGLRPCRREVDDRRRRRVTPERTGGQRNRLDRCGAHRLERHDCQQWEPDAERRRLGLPASLSVKGRCPGTPQATTRSAVRSCAPRGARG